jgi:hypothetical protein
MVLSDPTVLRIARRNRLGMSMAEVLVALFLLALGTIAILTLFPIGMFQMATALKDDRTAQAAVQADAFMRMQWRLNVVEPVQSGNPVLEPMFSAMDDPDTGAPFDRSVPTVAGQAVPSYPVFVDPMGWFAPWASLNSPYQQSWVGYSPPNSLPNPFPNSPPYIPRRTLAAFLASPLGAQRTCSLMDGFGYNENGTPSSSSGALERELRYNWLWVLQRADNSNTTTANMTVVVFDKRAFQYAPQNAEAVYTSSLLGGGPVIGMQPLSTTISVPYGIMAQNSAPFQKGGWLLDGTPALRHAYFYRVVSITDNPGSGTTDIEVQPPIRRIDGSTSAYPGTLIYMAGVSEVFERPVLTPFDF